MCKLYMKDIIRYFSIIIFSVVYTVFMNDITVVYYRLSKQTEQTMQIKIDF